MEQVNIVCPNCKMTVHVPFMRELQAKAIKRADMLEMSARQELEQTQYWLRHASLWTFFKVWWHNRRR